MGSPHNTLHSKSMSRQYTCSKCERRYAMEWAKNNHQKLCKEGNKNG